MSHCQNVEWRKSGTIAVVEIATNPDLAHFAPGFAPLTLRAPSNHHRPRRTFVAGWYCLKGKAPR